MAVSIEGTTLMHYGKPAEACAALNALMLMSLLLLLKLLLSLCIALLLCIGIETLIGIDRERGLSMSCDDGCYGSPTATILPALIGSLVLSMKQ